MVNRQGGAEAEKEKEKGREKESESEALRHASSTDKVKYEIHDHRDEVVELQGRLGELGIRKMAKIATAPSNLSTGPKTQSAAVSVAPQTASSIVTHSHPSSSAAMHLQDRRQEPALLSTIPGYQVPLQENPRVHR